MISVILYDNYDSFSYLLMDYLISSGAKVTVYTNDCPYEQLLEATRHADAVVLSPGPESPPKAGHLMRYLKNIYNQKPILGICLGHQAIGMQFGLQLTHAPKAVHGKPSVIEYFGNHPIAKNIPLPMQVGRYHSLVLEGKSNDLNILAQSADDHCIMAIAHQSLPLIGLQFHPESILTHNGIQFIQNWIHSCKQNTNHDVGVCNK
jgi:anthranilate synthase component 2